VFKFYYRYIVSSFNSTTRSVNGTPLLFLEISTPVSAVNINVFLINEIDLARKLYHQVTPILPCEKHLYVNRTKTPCIRNNFHWDFKQ